LENFATGRLESPPYNLGNTPLTLFLVGKSGPGAPGDWKVARTRGQECPRYVRFFQNPALILPLPARNEWGED